MEPFPRRQGRSLPRVCFASSGLGLPNDLPHHLQLRWHTQSMMQRPNTHPSSAAVPEEEVIGVPGLSMARPLLTSRSSAAGTVALAGNGAEGLRAITDYSSQGASDTT